MKSYKAITTINHSGKIFNDGDPVEGLTGNEIQRLLESKSIVEISSEDPDETFEKDVADAVTALTMVNDAIKNSDDSLVEENKSLKAELEEVSVKLGKIETDFEKLKNEIIEKDKIIIGYKEQLKKKNKKNQKPKNKPDEKTSSSNEGS